MTDFYFVFVPMFLIFPTMNGKEWWQVCQMGWVWGAAWLHILVLSLISCVTWAIYFISFSLLSAQNPPLQNGNNKGSYLIGFSE